MLYIGVSNHLKRRVVEHEMGLDKGFSTKYNCKYLIYFEAFRSINNAIKIEKELKGWRREKKDKLIKTSNPQLAFLNASLKEM